MSIDRHQLPPSSDVLPPRMSSPTLQRKCGRGASEVPSIVHDVIREAGRPLDPDAREMMESQFGQDFSSVRVHTSARAEASARAVRASAYTVGRDVVFAKGRYSPHDSGGQKLLAHELAHVVQQGGVDARDQAASSLRLGGAGEERFADRAADAVTRGDRVPDVGRAAAGVMLQKQDDTTERVEAEPGTAEPLQTGAPTPQNQPPGRHPSACRTAEEDRHPALPISGNFRAETGIGSLPIFCVTRSRVQLTIRGDWREQIANPTDRPGDQRSRRPDRPPFFLTMHGWWTGGSRLTTGDITPGVERTFTFDDVETAPEGVGYRVEINCVNPQRNRVLYGPYSVSQG